MSKANSVLFHVHCDECQRKNGVRLAERCDRNLRPEQRKLCPKCRHRLGFREAYGDLRSHSGKYKL